MIFRLIGIGFMVAAIFGIVRYLFGVEVKEVLSIMFDTFVAAVCGALLYYVSQK